MAENNKDLDMPCKHKNHTGLKHIGLKLEVKTARVNGLLRPCHTTTYSTNVCRRMKNSASMSVYAEYVRNKFKTRY